MASNLRHGQIVSGGYLGGGINTDKLDHIRKIHLKIFGNPSGIAHLVNLAGSCTALRFPS